MALGSTEPVTEMGTRKVFCGVKAAGASGWQTYWYHIHTVFKSGSLNLLETSRPVQASKWIALLLRRRSQKCEERLLALSRLSVRPCFLMEQRGSHCKDIHYMSIFRKSVQKVQVLLKSDVNNGYLTWSPIWIFGHISFNSWNEKCFGQRL